MAKLSFKCDLRIAKNSKHRTLYKFDVDEGFNYIYVCADCLGVLVRDAWSMKTDVFVASTTEQDEE